jgi:hypothetical protein
MYIPVIRELGQACAKGVRGFDSIVPKASAGEAEGLPLKGSPPKLASSVPLKEIRRVICLLDNLEGRSEKGEGAVCNEPRSIELKKLKGFRGREGVECAQRWGG